MPVLLPVGSLDAGRPPAPARAPVTTLLALACAVVFVGPQDAGRSGDWAQTFGAVPADLFGGGAHPAGAGWGALTLVTSLVSHASWPHLLYNLMALWVFGSALERTVGSARFAGLFLVGGVLATLAQAALWPASEVSIVGASGAVAAVAGAFAVAFPRARVVVAAVFLTLPVRVWVALGAWAVVEVAAGTLAAFRGAGGAGGVAHGAHVAGFAVGVLAMAVGARAQGVLWGRPFLRRG